MGLIWEEVLNKFIDVLIILDLSLIIIVIGLIGFDNLKEGYK